MGVELSSSFVVKLRQRCGSYLFSPFFVNFGQFWGTFLCPLIHSHINVLWASIRESVWWNLSVSNPVYVVSIIYAVTLFNKRYALIDVLTTPTSYGTLGRPGKETSDHELVSRASPSYAKERERVRSKGSHFRVPTLNIERGQSDCRMEIMWHVEGSGM